MPSAGVLMMLNRLLFMPGVAYCRFVLARTEAQRDYGAATESHNENTRNTLEHSTCSHTWWETLKGLIFYVMPCIPALRWPGGALVVATAEKAPLLGTLVSRSSGNATWLATRLSQSGRPSITVGGAHQMWARDHRGRYAPLLSQHSCLWNDSHEDSCLWNDSALTSSAIIMNLFQHDLPMHDWMYHLIISIIYSLSDFFGKDAKHLAQNPPKF